ncbi:MAG: queuosine precursor transporter [Oscillospiraceae bacterium]|nr:queuosine precursor transporter [Oscillospiraceae bacterium]
MNILIFLLATAFFLLAAVAGYRLFGPAGLYAYVCFATILANIQVCKSIEMLGLTTTAAAALYASTYLCTDILSECHGRDAAKKAVWLGVFINLVWLAGTQLTLWFVPSESDTIQSSLQVVFGAVPRICTASLISYVISQRLDVSLYHLIWRKTGGGSGRLWLRNNGSTLISQLADSALFVAIAFVGAMPARTLVELMATTYFFKAVVALCDTPFAYLARHLKQTKQMEE